MYCLYDLDWDPTGVWVNCATEGDKCAVNGVGVVRYGAYGNWTFRLVSDTHIDCSSDYFGDPSHGNTKECWTIPASIENPQWKQCAHEGGACKFDGTRLLRFGESGSYVYQTGYKSINCNEDNFGGKVDDSHHGKTCDQSRDYQSSFNDNWVECASSKGLVCNLPTNDAIFYARYGSKKDGRYDIRAISMPYFSCDDNVFIEFDKGQSHDSYNCAYYVKQNFIYQFFNPTGYWSLASNSCPQNATCTMTLSEGVDSTTSKSTSKQWASHLQETIKQSLIFEGSSVSFDVSSQISETMSKSLTIHLQKSCSVTCDTSNGPKDVYQWKTGTQEINYKSSEQNQITEEFNTFQCSWLCVDPSNKPKCPLGDCADPNCQKCISDWKKN